MPYHIEETQTLHQLGIFDQTIRVGWQVEITDKWLQKGNPWEIVRPEIAYYVTGRGHTEHSHIRQCPRGI